MRKIVPITTNNEVRSLFGSRDENIKLVENAFGVQISSRADGVHVTSNKKKSLEKALDFITHVLGLIRQGKELSKQEIAYLLSDFKKTGKMHINNGQLIKDNTSRPVGPKTKGQRAYVEAIKDYDIVFAIGPAGTGKTYLAMAMAVEAFKSGRVRRIILTRPAIEAGESLGYLPGTFIEKISPYLRPLYDALYDMMDVARIEKFIEMGIIEVAPLAYMRGRTLNDAFIILDEAQNCTADQMKMFLTRLGFDSKAVITGDITQSDLPEGNPAGLIQAKELLSDIEGIKFIYFDYEDVVRHELVQEIIEAYEKANKIRNK